MIFHDFGVAFFYNGEDDSLRMLLLAQHRMSIEARDAAVTMTAAGGILSSSCLRAISFFSTRAKICYFYDGDVFLCPKGVADAPPRLIIRRQ